MHLNTIISQLEFSIECSSSGVLSIAVDDTFCAGS